MFKTRHLRLLFAVITFIVFSFTPTAFAAESFENIRFDTEPLQTNGHFDFSSTGEEAYPLGEVTDSCLDIEYGIRGYEIYKGLYPNSSQNLGGGTGWMDWSFFSDVDVEAFQVGDGDYWIFFQIGHEDNGDCRAPLFVDTLYSTMYRSNGVWSAGMLPNCYDGIKNQDETGVDVGGICQYIDFIYSSPYADTSEKISSSFNKIVQTLGTNLEGILTRIDIQSSNSSYRFYRSRPWITLYECDDDTYGSATFNGSNCDLLYSDLSNDNSQLEQSTQSFYVDSPVFLNPQKYYFFTTQGSNIFNVLPTYFGSIEDTVDGSCFQFRLTNPPSVAPCATVSDLFFNFHGVVKSAPPSCTVDCFSNVLFLPGLKASRLYNERPDGSEDQLWEPNGNSDVEDLYLNTDGTSKDSSIYTRDIIKETNSPVPLGFAGQNIYKSFSNMMDGLVEDGDINEWTSYAYDWRQGVEDIVNNGTKYQVGDISLTSTLESLVDSSKSGKVTIVAHSNGGLLAKALLKKLQDDQTAGVSDLIDSVDVLILVAVPEIGTASAVPAIIHGYDQRILGGVLMGEAHARELGRNMLGAFGLLPSKEYINRVSASPVTFVDTAIPSDATTKLVQAFGSALDSYAEYKSFLFGGEGRVDPAPNQTNLPISLSSSLFASAELLHDDIDAWTPSGSLRVIEVAGWGLDTVASFEYYPICENSSSADCNFTLDERPRFTSDGDGTVVVPSAQYMGFLGSAEKYWVNLPRYNRFFNFTVDREHKDILEVDQLNNLIQSVINEEEITFDTILRNTEPVDTSDRLRLSIHSPVTLDAYDVDGNHTGKVCPPESDFCYIEENILNSSYMEFGEGKYINLPEDQLLRVELQGTDTGTFTYISEKVTPDGVSNISSFTDIPVTIQTQAEIVLNNETGVLEIELDKDGDGTVDETVLPDGTELSLNELIALLKVNVQELDIKDKLKKNILKKIKKLEKKIDKKIKKNAKDIKKLGKKISKEEMKGKIDTASADEILSLLDLLEVQAEGVILDASVLTELNEKIQSLDIKKKLKKSLLKRVEKLEKKHKLVKTLSKLSKDITKKAKKGKIADEDAQAIIDILDQIQDVI